MSSLRGGGDGGSSRGRRQKKRPEWNNDFVEAAPVGAPASAPRAAPASDQHYYSRMRQELKNPHAAPDDGPFDDVDAASRRGGGGGGGATSRPGSGRQRHSHRRRRSSRDHDRGVRDDRPAWNNDFAEPVAAPVPTHASSASATGPTRGGVASKPRVGRLYTPADITGEAPQEQHRYTRCGLTHVAGCVGLWGCMSFFGCECVVCAVCAVWDVWIGMHRVIPFCCWVFFCFFVCVCGCVVVMMGFLTMRHACVCLPTLLVCVDPCHRTTLGRRASSHHPPEPHHSVLPLRWTPKGTHRCLCVCVCVLHV